MTARAELVPPKAPGVVQVRPGRDGGSVVWARNRRGFLTCITTARDVSEATTTHVSAAQKGTTK
jgi:hypothetical protein